MNSLQFLHYTLSFGVLVIVAIAITFAVYMIQMLRSAQRILDSLESTTEGIQDNIQMLKSGVQVGILSILGKILGRGGDSK